MEHGIDTRLTALLGRHILERIVASSSEAVVLLDAQDPKRPIVYANPAYESLSGYGVDQLIGRPWPLLGQNGAEAPELERLRAAVGRGEACSISVSDTRKDGATWSVGVTLRPLRSPHGELEYLLCQHKADAPVQPEANGSCVDIGLLQHALGQARRRVAALDKIDPVTGLLRYEHFLTLLARDLGVARRERNAVSLLGFEIVELDVYRATFGSKAAEACLRMIGAQVAGAFRRASDSCARCDESQIVAAVLGQEPEVAAALGERVAIKVRGLGLHNPRARTGRQVWIRHVVVGADTNADDAAALVGRVKAELAAAREPEQTRTGS